MKKINDRILLGIISGLISGIPGRVLNRYEYHKGLADVTYERLAAGMFFPKSQLNTKEGKLIGYITNQVNLGITGVIITYLLSATGRDKAILKGVGVSTVAWIFIYGLASKINTKGKKRKNTSPLLSFIDHLCLGILCGWFVSKLGDDSLFPDSRQYGSQEKFPLFSVMTNRQCKQSAENTEVSKI